MDNTRDNRDQIMDAAEHLFGRHGYAGVSINQLCKASGLPVGSVYHHFGSKAGVLRAVLERGSAGILAGLPTDDALNGSPLEKLATSYRVAADLITARLPLLRLLASLELHQTGDADVLAILREANQRARTQVASVIEPVARSCGVPDAAECAEELAAIHTTFLTGLVVSTETTSSDVRAGIEHRLHRLIVASILDRVAES
ncbi:TetR/AcrR family transcriptional regulator [Streptomyces griseorubiginosus]|uniref:TetR/AcrR family transcriptional regulator n=1 Tax=Streptomyces griseorubiginosus TaxID=67304 RepID=UPI0033B2D72D